ncbi:hypothetical protein Z949_4072 [Sulfitobacter guttiformis KCTC 32187]|nr:hypothetical protein Z949_4072 [Sulfitobacter guttiformis KCTC 32187]
MSTARWNVLSGEGNKGMQAWLAGLKGLIIGQGVAWPALSVVCTYVSLY